MLVTPFLDVSGLVSTDGERGLLGLAFDPKFAVNRRFYIDYTASDGTSTVARYTVQAATPDRADAGSAEILLTIPRKESYHNGGQLAFGPDGYLYVASGDGAEGGWASTQLNNLAGKVLRLDVSGVTGYSVPDDNPFFGQPGAREEIWAYGLRNPWRFSFDRETGDLYIADVGEDSHEELDYQPAASQGGENYGWNVMEGNSCYTSAGCDTGGLTLPVLAYDHGAATGKSVTGGYIYRGDAIESLKGRYVFADFISGNLWWTSAHDEWPLGPLVQDTGLMVSTLGEDEDGEIYVADYVGGRLYKLIDD